MLSLRSAKDPGTMGKALVLVLTRKETRYSLMKAVIAHIPLPCSPGSHLTKLRNPLSSIPHLVEEEDTISSGRHHQVLCSTWAPAADVSHFHSAKLSRDTGLHLPPLQSRRAACLSPSSTAAVMVYYRRERSPRDGEKDLWLHTESQGWSSRLFHSP